MSARQGARRGAGFFQPFFDAVDAPPAMRAFVLSELASPARAWHGLLHHALMLRNLTRARWSEVDRRRLILAVLFHDIVYDATRPDNEEQSAELAREWTYGPDAEPVAALILATKRHDLDADPVTRALLLADLGVLWSSSRSLYAFYAHGIRTEYAHVPTDSYRTGRARVLEQLGSRLGKQIQGADAASLARNLHWELRGLAEGAFDHGR